MPTLWWLVGGGMLTSLWVVLSAGSPAGFRWRFFLLGVLLPAVVVDRRAAVRIRVSGTTLRVGRAADDKARVVLRPYLADCVKITIDDPDDPAPYWLLSTRDAVHLALAVLDLQEAAADPDPP